VVLEATLSVLATAVAARRGLLMVKKNPRRARASVGRPRSMWLPMPLSSAAKSLLKVMPHFFEDSSQIISNLGENSVGVCYPQRI
jgi:hypothetical protein